MTTIRKNILLGDPTYFCNKSWTISYHVNAKAWISFHSYLPNFYIAENNFFYSGSNSCCDNIDFLVGEIDNTPDCIIVGHCHRVEVTTTTTTTSTSTTSTTSTSTSTTSSTTTTIWPCTIIGYADEVAPPTTTTTTTSSSTTTTTTAEPTTTTTTSSTSTSTTTAIFCNPEMSQWFQKDDCPAGPTYGDWVLYTVPAGTYCDPSLVTAIAMAQADIDANGQNNANTLGGCEEAPPTTTTTTTTTAALTTTTTTTSSTTTSTTTNGTPTEVSTLARVYIADSGETRISMHGEISYSQPSYVHLNGRYSCPSIQQLTDNTIYNFPTDGQTVQVFVDYKGTASCYINPLVFNLGSGNTLRYLLSNTPYTDGQIDDIVAASTIISDTALSPPSIECGDSKYVGSFVVNTFPSGNTYLYIIWDYRTGTTTTTSTSTTTTTSSSSTTTTTTTIPIATVNVINTDSSIIISDITVNGSSLTGITLPVGLNQTSSGTTTEIGTYTVALIFNLVDIGENITIVGSNGVSQCWATDNSHTSHSFTGVVINSSNPVNITANLGGC